MVINMCLLLSNHYSLMFPSKRQSMGTLMNNDSMSNGTYLHIYPYSQTNWVEFVELD